MKDLSTKYLGLTLRNPIIAASSGLTASVKSIKTLEKNGASAVVLKSLFEEEILSETHYEIKRAEEDSMIYSELSETLDYIDLHIKEDRLNEYLNLIREAKKEVLIPVIASINCISYEDWTHFTSRIEEAGADALELNIFLNPADFDNKEFEKVYFTIIEKVTQIVQIPVSIKISKYFTRLGLTARALSETGIKGMVLFNRFYTPDIDIEKMEMGQGKLYSNPEESLDTLRWIAILSSKVQCDLSASTGIHTGNDVIKMLLAGARTVQIASTLYRNGPDHIVRMLGQIEDWMEKKGFNSVNQFIGKVNAEYKDNPAAFERMQFMKNFSRIG
ncbi:MAG: dihydroorotate dehydrogenase-like protein [Bacteroidales bacterium]|nr:dihydroorotate dehydrogenase-like protein [Bacteroidales bacterium]MBN2697588.1 dihydroorotate dehydrogenase-like protein [Bacteroidales bacterium]